MSFLTRILRQNAVLFAQGNTLPDDYGVPVTATPVQIKCRWEDRTENIIKKDGTEQTCSSVVLVDRDVAPGDILVLGTIAGLVDAVVARNNPTAREVLAFDKVPNFKATEFVKTAYL